MTILEKEGVSTKPSAAASKHAPTRVMTYQAYLDWADEDVHAEWVACANSDEGEVTIQIPPKDIHQAIESLRMCLAAELSVKTGRAVDPRDVPSETITENN